MGQILKRYRERQNPANRRYAKFKAQDLKTGKPIEVSCDPACLSNYFERGSNRPLEMSPAFFRAEVLQKYKADPSKYELTERSILCRGAWHLETYDINDEGQVHTYLRYLSNLPYQEQVYWQAFNECPKGALSRRAIETDFEGTFSKEYDPLEALKHKVEALDRKSPEWWNPRGKELSRIVHYPVTGSPSEWAESILALDQLVIEGLNDKRLRALAGTMDLPVETNWRSIKLLEACLVGRGVEKEEANSVAQALHTIHHLRTIAKGHAVPEKKAEAIKGAWKNYGSLREHFKALATDCDNALRVVLTKLDA